MNTTHWIAVLALGLGLGACSDNATPSTGGNIGPTGVTGDLGNGTFFYLCTDDADAVCDDGGSDFPVGSSFALGSSFGMIYRTAKGARGEVRSGAPERLRDFGNGGFVAERTGTVAIIASTGSDARDILHIDIAEMAEMDLEAEQKSLALDLDQDILSLDAGDRLELRVAPLDEDGRQLAGAIPTEWVSGDLSVVSFSGSDRNNNVELLAERAGVAQIYVTMGDFSRTISVTVMGNPLPDEAADKELWVDDDFTQLPQGGGGGAGGGGGVGGAGGQGGN